MPPSLPTKFQEKVWIPKPNKFTTATRILANNLKPQSASRKIPVVMIGIWNADTLPYFLSDTKGIPKSIIGFGVPFLFA